MTIASTLSLSSSPSHLLYFLLRVLCVPFTRCSQGASHRLLRMSSRVLSACTLCVALWLLSSAAVSVSAQACDPCSAAGCGGVQWAGKFPTDIPDATGKVINSHYTQQTVDQPLPPAPSPPLLLAVLAWLLLRVVVCRVVL